MAEQAAKPPALESAGLPILPPKHQKKRASKAKPADKPKSHPDASKSKNQLANTAQLVGAVTSSREVSSSNKESLRTGEEEEDSGEERCVVCCETMTETGLGECGHRVCCGLCTFRLRLLHKDEKCVLCKQRLERLFIVKPDDPRKHDDLVKLTWGRKGTGLAIDERSDIFFSDACKDFKEHMDSLREPRCDECAVTFPTVAKLEKHLSETHKTFLCKQCLEHRGLFIMEHTRYSSSELAAHCRPNGDNSLEGHPQCKFCKGVSFYNMDMLYKHLNEKHESCHLCAKQGNKYQYFRDYNALEAHFSHSHFACDDPKCRENRFVVFLTELQLQAHITNEHPERADSRPLNLDFVYRGSRRAQHLGERTGDDEAEERHDQMFVRGPDAESFPPLPGAGSSMSTAMFRPVAYQQVNARLHNRNAEFPDLASTITRNTTSVPPQSQGNRRYLSTASMRATPSPSPSPPPQLSSASVPRRPTPAMEREVSSWCSMLIDGETTAREVCSYLTNLLGESNLRERLPDIKAAVGPILAKELDACMDHNGSKSTNTSRPSVASAQTKPPEYDTAFPALSSTASRSSSSRLSRAEVRDIAFAKKAPTRTVAAPVGARALSRNDDVIGLEVTRNSTNESKKKGSGKSQRKEIMEMALKYG